MPIYEYVCLDCREQFDALRPMGDADAPIACVECESEHTSRTISVFFAQSGGRGGGVAPPPKQKAGGAAGARPPLLASLTVSIRHPRRSLITPGDAHSPFLG